MLKNKKGIALIMSVGILAIMSIIATSFAVNMRVEQEVALNYLRSIKAKYIAEAGIHKAIAELKLDAKTNFVYNADSVNKGTYSDSTLQDGYGSYSVIIEDEQRKVNINYANLNLLEGLLGDEAKANAVIQYRGEPLTKPFKTIEEIKLVIGDAAYEDIKDYITVNSYLDPNTIDDTGEDEPRCPINVNTASDEVLKAVLSPLGAADADIGPIKGGRPISTWKQFNDIIDGLSLSDEIKNNIKDNCNPNREKPSVYTTDFCFFSGGKYALESTGTLFDSSAKTKKVAEKKIKAIVDVYGILNQTKKSQFQGNEGDTTPVAFKVNTYDSCPVESINSTNSWEKGTTYTTVNDSIKNGFWDNMSDTWTSTNNEMFYATKDGDKDEIPHWWKATTANRLSDLWLKRPDIVYTPRIEDDDGDGNSELIFQIPFGPPQDWIIPRVFLGNAFDPPSELIWDDFAWRTKFSDGNSPYQKDRNYPTGNFDEWEVMLHISRYGQTELSDESRMKQEFGKWGGGTKTDTNEGQFQTDVGGNQWQSGKIAGAYYVENTFITVSAGINKHYFYAHKANGRPDFQLYDTNQKTSTRNSGPIGWYAFGAMETQGIRSRVDNVRIIPAGGTQQNTPYFESKSLPSQVGNVTWALITGTVILSAGGNSDSEKVYFQTSTDGGANWTPAFPGVLPGSPISSSSSSNIQYRANFITLDNPTDNPVSDPEKNPYYSETIALEDITITYLPSTEILYFEETSD